MKHYIEHDLGVDVAKKVATHALETYRERYPNADPQAKWVTDRQADFSVKLKGMKLAGKIQVEERRIAIDLDVPFLLRPFRGMAMDVVEREVKTWIAKAKAGEIS